MAVQFIASKLVPGQSTAGTTDTSGAVVTGPASNAPIPPFEMRPDSMDAGATYSLIPRLIAPIWPQNSELDLTIVVSPSFAHQPLGQVQKDRIVVDERNFKLGDKKDNRVVDTTIYLPKEVQNNGTLWGHFYFGLAGQDLDPSSQGYDSAKAVHFIHPLTQYLTKKKVIKTKNLLAAVNETEESEEQPSGPVITSFYHSNFTMSFIPDSGTLPFAGIQPGARQFVHLETTGARDSSGQNGWYYPILFVNTFWQLKAHMTELNSTVTTVPFHVDLNNQANWLFQILASIDANSKEAARQAALGNAPPGGGDGSEFEMIKEVLLDTNIYLLGTTVVVSIFHMLFEFLAFTSDIVSSSPF